MEETDEGATCARRGVADCSFPGRRLSPGSGRVRGVERDADRRVAELLRVDRLPTTLILSPEADLMGRMVGSFDAAPFLDSLMAAAAEPQRFGQVIPADGTADR